MVAMLLVLALPALTGVAITIGLISPHIQPRPKGPRTVDAYDYGDDDYDPLDNDTSPKEEPDCFSCGDSGCPDCGHVNPDDPSHLRAVALQILQSRIPVIPRNVEDQDSRLVYLPAAAVATVRELVASAVISTEIHWRTPAQQAALKAAETPF